MVIRSRGVCLPLLFACCASAIAAEPGHEAAETIVSRLRVKRGIGLDIGCGDARLAIALAKATDLNIRCVESDPEAVRRARAAIDASRLHGTRISVDESGLAKLPYPTHCAALVVCGDGLAEGLRERDLKELFRVLNPNGVAVIGGSKVSKVQLTGWLRAAEITHFKLFTDNGTWAEIRKPFDSSWDEWTHRNHDPANTFGTEKAPAPPFKLQWTSRAQPALASSSMLLAGGRQFIVCPEYPKKAHITPSIHVLDAFTGVELWKRVGRKELPINRPLHHHGPEKTSCDLLVSGNHLYVLEEKRCSLFNIQNGKIEKRFPVPQGASTDAKATWLYLACEKGLLYGGVGSLQKARTGWYNMARRGDLESIFALDAKSGAFRWLVKATGTVNSLVIGDGTVFFIDETHKLHALDAASGKERWTAPTGFPKKSAVTLASCYRGKLWVLHSDVGYYGLNKKKLSVFSMADGARVVSLPEAYNEKKGVCYSALSFAGKRVWASPQHGRALSQILDADTCKVVGRHRIRGKCGPLIATPRAVFNTAPGFKDVKAGALTRFHGLKPTCWYPPVPANGMLYLPAPGCKCNSPLRANLAFVSATAPKASGAPERVKGPAFGKLLEGAEKSDVWHGWRKDASRSAIMNQNGPMPTSKKWSVTQTGTLTGMAAAEGKVFFASDDHFCYALQMKDGQEAWRYRCMGAVRSAPWFEDGRLFVGDDAGWVHCLRARDGQLIWRFLAAPNRDTIICDGRIISRWPVRSGVVVHENVAYAAAGYFPNDMTHVYALNPATGEEVWRRKFAVPTYGPLAVGAKRLFIPSMGLTHAVTLAAPEKKAVPIGHARQSVHKGKVLALGNTVVTALAGTRSMHDVRGWVVIDEILPVVTRDTVFLRDGRFLTAENRAALCINKSYRSLGKFQPRPKTKTQAAPTLSERVRWSAWKGVRMTAVIKIGDVIYSGGQGKVYATAVGDGKERWSAEASGKVTDMAYSGGRLLAISKPSTVVCFGSGP